MKIKPLFDRVLLAPVPVKISEGGIHIPHEAAERSQIMTVVQAGDGTGECGEKINMVVSSGDQVIVSKYAGTEIVIDSGKFYILKQCDILAVISKEEK